MLFCNFSKLNDTFLFLTYDAKISKVLVQEGAGIDKLQHTLSIYSKCFFLGALYKDFNQHPILNLPLRILYQILSTNLTVDAHGYIKPKIQPSFPICPMGIKTYYLVSSSKKILHVPVGIGAQNFYKNDFSHFTLAFLNY